MAKREKIENERACAALSYILIGIIWYFADEKMRKSDFARYHAKQGLALLIADIIIWVIATIPFIGWIIGYILWVLLVILMIVGIINAVNGNMNPLPVIGGFGKGFNF